jgi:hypothetical protein
MAKYSKKAQESVKDAMNEMKEGKLKSGKSGKKVISKEQAVAIGLSEARRKGRRYRRRNSVELRVISAELSPTPASRSKLETIRSKELLLRSRSPSALW